MPDKELHNQELKDQITDESRIAFGTPGQTGAFNILWSKLKTAFNIGSHNELDGRSEDGAHPSSSITYHGTNLEDELDNADEGTEGETVIDSTEFMAQGANLWLFTAIKIWTYIKAKLGQGIQFIVVNTTSNPVYQQGLLFWDNTKKALSYYNDVPDITVNIGQEVLFRVYNGTGSDILNGTVVTPCSDTGLITLADSRYTRRSRLIAVATHDIPNATWGYVTRLGQVGGLNTSAYSAGETLYLGIEGGFTKNRPDDGAYPNILGVVDVVSVNGGIITVDPHVSELTVEITDTNGFPTTESSLISITVDEVLREVTISSSNGEFHFYEQGNKYEIEGDSVIAFPDVEGFVFVYYMNGVISYLSNPSPTQTKEIILKYAYVSTIYWNATDKKVEIDTMNEMHGISMSPRDHYYNHITRGAQYVSGISPGDFTLGNGNNAVDAQFSVSSGLFLDEDIELNTPDITVGTSIPIVYNLGANGVPRSVENAGFAVLSVPAGRLYYNQFTGGAWQLTEVTNRDYVLYHLFTFNGMTVRMISVMGQNSYATINQAREGASSEIANLISQLPFAEIIPIATIIYQTSTNYTNAVKGRVVEVESGVNYVDWRTSERIEGTPSTDHRNLTGKEADDQHPISAITDLQAELDSKVEYTGVSPNYSLQGLVSNDGKIDIANIYYIKDNSDFSTALLLAGENSTFVVLNDITLNILSGILSAAQINVIGGGRITFQALEVLPDVPCEINFDIDVVLFSSGIIENVGSDDNLTVNFRYIFSSSTQNIAITSDSGASTTVTYSDIKGITFSTTGTVSVSQLDKSLPVSNYLKKEGSNIVSTPTSVEAGKKFLIEGDSGFERVLWETIGQHLVWKDETNPSIIIKGTMAKLGGAFSIEAVVDFKNSASFDTVNLFPTALNGCIVRFEVAENILTDAPTSASSGFNTTNYIINKFYDDITALTSSSSSWGQRKGDGFIYSNGQDDAGTYKQTTSKLALCEACTLTLNWVAVDIDCIASITITGTIKGYV